MKLAKVVSIDKGISIENHKTIAALLVFFKNFENCSKKIFMDYFGNKNLLSNRLHRFCKKCSVRTAIAEVLEKITRAVIFHSYSQFFSSTVMT